MKTPADVERMAFPRLCALAEVAWTSRNVKSFDDFQKRINENHLPRLRIQGINYWERKTPCLTGDETHFVLAHINFGVVTGKGFTDFESASVRFDSHHPHFATMLIDNT